MVQKKRKLMFSGLGGSVAGRMTREQKVDLRRGRYVVSADHIPDFRKRRFLTWKSALSYAHGYAKQHDTTLDLVDMVDAKSWQVDADGVVG